MVFPTLEKISETNGISDVQSEAVDHISRLINEFYRYFSGFEHNTPVIAFTRNPFKYSVEDFPEDEQAIQEEFLDLIHDSSAKGSLDDETLDKFWAMMQNTYPKVAAKPLALLTAFPSTYLCESAFLSIVTIKTKARNKLLDVESDLRCAVSKIKPDIASIVEKKQKQKSH